MKVGLHPLLNDPHIDARQSSSQRQLSMAIRAIRDSALIDQNLDQASLPLNLCLVLDHSGSMNGRPLSTVKQAALNLINRLKPTDRISVVAFDHRAKVLVPNQPVEDVAAIKARIDRLGPDGGTAIDEGMKLGIEETAKGKPDRTSQIFLLTDGENEHGDNDRCLKLANLASEYNITVNALGFGAHWNQDVLEAIADRANGSLAYIESPEQAGTAFDRLFTRAQSVGLTNAHLGLELSPGVRLAELKPIAQVAPETVELTVQQEGNTAWVRLGDLMTAERIVLANLYIHQLPPGNAAIATVQVRYDDPATGQTGLFSERVPVYAEAQTAYQPQPEPTVQKSILALAKYRQTQIAETKLQEGDRTGAATMLQTAAKTALQLGDDSGATVLQKSATQLQSGEELSESDRKKTRIVSKTILQD
ncbi:MAG: VWA domain-containing protein [Spirulina sp. DLM2.Bin59]|nr:MAG: VWA domain-containing protein [Spirulina sp. DLM2.Bin59]